MIHSLHVAHWLFFVLKNVLHLWTSCFHISEKLGFSLLRTGVFHPAVLPSLMPPLPPLPPPPWHIRSGFASRRRQETNQECGVLPVKPVSCNFTELHCLPFEHFPTEPTENCTERDGIFSSTPPFILSQIFSLLCQGFPKI